MSRKKKTSSIDQAAVLRVFRERRKPLTIPEIIKALRAHKKEKQKLAHILDGLAEAGKLIRTRNAWGLTERMNLVPGVLQIQRSGVGFVIPDDKRRKDIFIAPKDFGEAWHGDRVVAAIVRERKTRHNEGRIVRVIERGTTRFTARVARGLGKGYYLCRPTDPRHRVSFMVEAKGDQAPGDEDVLIIEPLEQIELDLWKGTLKENLGKESDVAVQERLVKTNHNIPTTFPKSVLNEAGNLPGLPADKDISARRDLREVEFVTIDGAKARDFDDAIHVRREKNGYVLSVAIADVGHYVKPGSAMDREAEERANSYYFPQSVEPMFPEALSNGLCSLNPNVPRLAMVAEMRLNAAGNTVASTFYPATIQSHARLTYAQVNRALFENDQDERMRLAPVMELLTLAEELARKLAAKRKQRGTLDFDLPEPDIFFNIYGEAVDIRPKPRNFAHQIIEEFMIAANEAVAEFLTEKETPFLYRIHPEPDPDKVRSLFNVLSRTNLAEKVPEEADPKDIQRLLDAAEGTDLEFMVSRLTLRTMMQAKYSPQHMGHYGLASECYCHFTSPIRRYADLVVHRALKAALRAPGGSVLPEKRLKAVGDHLSSQERVAMDAEREIVKRITVLFLRDKVGQEFTGVVNSLADFGFWVELIEVMAEGLVRLSALDDDYYAFIPERQILLGERTGRIFKLGQTVRVKIEDVNLSRLEVTLALVSGGEQGETEAPGGKKPRQRPKSARGKYARTKSGQPKSSSAAQKKQSSDRRKGKRR